MQVRLVNGAWDGEGRVEIYREGAWGGVCDNQWTNMDATVVCRMLGYDVPGTAHNESFFGPGTGEIFLDVIYCDGTEETLDDCLMPYTWAYSCLTGGEAGVSCASGK